MTFVFRGYHVETQLHDGRASHVYRARRLADDGRVILKVLKPTYPPPERLAQFRREYETLRSLSAPGVVKAFSLETDERHWVLVQEDIGGESLDRLLAKQRYTMIERLELALRITDALGQIHEQRLIHKDINPSNIVWNSASGRLALIDFGIATRLSRERPTLRHPDRLEGTLAYIAPEQTGRMNRDIDYRTDFYSLGVTLYQIVTGELPFASADPMELVHCHIARRPVEPHQRAAEVPEGLSAIVMKLITKMAEARYQSSYGIKADLAHCLEQLKAAGTAPPFQLGRADVSESFHVPQKLYGRDREIAALLQAFERVAGGAGDAGETELVLVKGYSGIGKSALVHELHGAITGWRGHFAAGKFDQLQRGTPYAAVVSAFRSLARQLLGEREARLARWREQLLAALGTNGRLITEVIPEIELIVGPQPPVPDLNAAESQNRFKRVFQSFVRVFAQRAHPLVLFLDDLQWADSASLKLIELMIADDQPGHLLLIGAYRDNEVDQAHPLVITLDALRRAGATLQEIHVPPLGQEHVDEFVADALQVGAEDAGPLARLVARKTGGNPLFIAQLLKEVHADGLITLDRGRGAWRWDIGQIEARAITDNVVNLMIGKLRRQPEATQEALRLAACLGNRFDVETLALIREQPASEAYAALLPAIGEGLLLPASEPEIALPDVASAPIVAREYRFLHDRVQQAAYSLMDAPERKRVHARAGRLLLRGIPEEERAERVFEIVDQLNRGRDLIDDPAERAELARLNLRAGQRAKRAAAYAAARDYLVAALEALRSGAWDDDYDLASSVHRHVAEAEALVGNFVRAETLTAELLARVQSPIEKADAYELVVGQATMLARYNDALDAARSGLALLGVELPAEDLERAIAEEAAAIDALLGGRPIASLIDEPLVQDPRARTAIKLLVSAVPPSFYTDLLRYGLVVHKMVRTSLEYGLSPGSADLFVYYGHLLAIQGQHRAAYEFAELSVRLSEKFKSPGDKCRSCFVLANFILPWSKHLRCAQPINDDGYRAGLEGGEFLMGGYILFYKLLYAFFEGAPIERTLADVPAFLQFNQRAKNQLGIDFILAFRRAAGILTGASQEETSEEEYLAACERNQSAMAICFYHILRAQALYLLGRPAEAFHAASAAERRIQAIAGNGAVAVHNFYSSLCLTALIPGAPAGERARLEEKLRDNQEKMAAWAKDAGENFAHMHALVAAEQARIEGRQKDAIDLYDRAMQDARENGFAQDEALSNELAGRFWIARGKHRIGIGHISDSLYGYRQWGAHAKVKALLAEFPELGVRTRSLDTVITTEDQDGSALDLSSVLKASHAISGEIVLEKLLTKLMEIVIENAGAERGVLLLDKDGELYVHVDTTAVHGQAGHGVAVRLLEPRRVAQYHEVAEPIVVYVQRTRETVLLSDAHRDGPFTGIPYVLREKPRSVLVMPLSVQGKLLGVLYLENNLTAGAFTQSRFEVLKLLSSQFGISLENALLYSEMEQRVADRTTELKQKNLALERALRDLETAQVQLIHAEKMASLGRLTAGISHEIKNPLHFINNFAALNAKTAALLVNMLEETPELPLSEARDDLLGLKRGAEKVVEHGLRANAIINSMMQHASAGSGERRLVELNSLVEHCVKLCASGRDIQRPGAVVSLERAYDPGAGRVEVDPQDVSRVFVNLLNNAVYAVLEKQRTSGSGYRPVVSVRTERRGHSVEVRVTDNGVGISAAIREKIFEPFFTTKPPGSGTGLGLPLSYDVVKAHRGTIAVESEEGRGATFIVALPG